MAQKGRPPKLNKKVIEKFCELLKKGNYIITICKLLKIHEDTYYKWRSRGEEESKDGKKTIYAQFFESIEAADATAEIELLNQVDNPKWVLSRRWPKNWGKREYVEQKNIDGGKDEYAQKAEKSEAVRKALLDLQQSLEDDERDSRGSGDGSK